MKAQDTSELFFDEVRVPVANLLGGKEGQGFFQLMQQLPQERLIIAVSGVGAMERALEITVDYTKERKAFGQRCWDFQNTRFKLAEVQARCWRRAPSSTQCMVAHLEGELDAARAALAKYWVSEQQCKVMDECLQLFGGYGYMMEYPIAELYVDARVQRIYGGTNEIMKVTLPLLALGHLEPGQALLMHVYAIDEAIVERVTEYLIYLAPLVVIAALRFYYTGLLVQARLTGWVTLLNVLFLSTVIVALMAGFSLGLRPVVVLVGAEGLAMLLHLAATVAVHRRWYRPPAVPDHEDLTYRELTGFFVPVSTTGVMFALSRPVLFAFMSRAPGGLVAIAALRVGFDFSMLFQQAANQFRHFFVTFGLDDLARKRRFMALVCAGITTIMLAFAVTPLSNLIWRDLMRIPDDVRALSVDVMLVMCLMPAVIVFRNYFHGRLMVERRTVGMAAGAILRVAGIYLAAQALYGAGWLNHVTASLVLILGFVIEAAVVVWAARRPAQTAQGLRVNATAKM
jgi:hypothetical protein